jgi:hypothetical protein
MNKNSLLKYIALSAKLIALFSLQVITIFEVHALSCIPLFHNSDEVRERLGRADIVVLGKIERVGKPFFSGWGESVSADVKVEQLFKGTAAATIEVLVKSTIQPDQLVVLFARRESADQASQRARSVLEKSKSSAAAREASSEPLLQADGQCNWALTLADTREGRLDLQHLRELPPVGSGGSMKLHVSTHSASRWEGGYGTGVGKLSLTLFDDNKKYVSVTNDQGEAVFANLPAGRYAMKLPAVSGFTINCMEYATADCNSFVVTDRGLHRYSVRYDPDASVEIALVDADDRIVKAMASFRLTRLETLVAEQTTNAVFAHSKNIQFANKMMSSSRSGRDQHVAVPPGRYSLELLLSDIRAQTPSKANKFSSYRVVSARSVKTMSTSSIDLRSGDNKIVFKLSRDLTPKALSYSVRASQHPNTRKLYFNEMLLDVDNKNGATSIHNFNTHSAYEKSHQVIVIPGQSWEVSATDYSNGVNDVIEGRAVVQINGDKNVVLDVSTKRK